MPPRSVCYGCVMTQGDMKVHLSFERTISTINYNAYIQNELKIMSRITEDLLRKRSEHNESRLTTLEEVSLHQQEIIKIENLDVLCRHLKILYLQNNIIQKMENLNKLKELEYLNMALNNVSKIENIQGCESLKKLDMTVNFVDIPDIHESAICLSKLPNLKEIYLTGNPCEDWPGCKDYIIAHVSTLQSYNGQTVTPSQRIKAQQLLPTLRASLFEAIQKHKLKKRQQEYEEFQRKENEKDMTEEERAKQKIPYTREARREMYEKMASDKEKKQRQRNPQKYKPEKPIEMYNKNGQIRQCNQGKYKFSLQEYIDPDYTFFQIQVPRHLQTSELEVNINPSWLSVRIKKQLTQLRLSQQIIVHESKSERSKMTGELKLTLKKLKPNEYLRYEKDKEANKKKNEEKELKKKQQEEHKNILRLCDQYQKKVEREQDEIPDLQ